MNAPLHLICCDYQRLLLHTEPMVRRFSRYHKYTVGTYLWQQAMAVMRTVHRAVYEKPQLDAINEVSVASRLSVSRPARWQVMRHRAGRSILNASLLIPQGAPMNTLLKLLTAVVCLLLATPVFAQFIPSADGGEIYDSKTGLIWRRCSEGKTWSGSTCIGTAATYTHEQALSHAKTQTGWRLPSIQELASIADPGLGSPTIDAVAFPATPASSYWTSSPYVGDASNAWYIFFGYCGVDMNLRTLAFYVRLVR